MNQPGTILQIGSIEQVTERFKKRDLVLEIPGNYPQKVKFEAHGDKVSIFDGLKVGQSVNVFFNLNGRESNGKFYNTLQAFKVE